MASRSRGAARSAPNHANQDADEERRLWKEIRDKSASVDEMVVSLSHFCVIRVVYACCSGFPVIHLSHTLRKCSARGNEMESDEETGFCLSCLRFLTPAYS